jgi:DNA-binding NtrC family response regulator
MDNGKRKANTMSRHRILVVDRASNMRFVVANLLDDEGFDVLTAGDNDDALERAKALRPDVILVNLESRDDLAAISRLASVGTEAEIIVLAPYGDTALALEAMSCGASHYVMKPLSRVELLVVIHRAVEHHDLTREVAELRLELGRTAPSIL